ncbi:MAG: deoxynucleoside kinase [Chloroflexia bacterium]|nr:deoxynucleoside kinase [Chloroflexia bacterium]
MFIVIEGVIGVGKTTLSRLLQPHFEAELLLEIVEENPFLPRFYQDQARYAFQTQMFFLLSRYRQQRITVPEALQQSSLISDYLLDKDRIFAQLTLEGDEWWMYQRLYEILDERLVRPTLVVYLRAGLDVLMGRIAMRDRSFERSMPRDYIERLRLTYEDFFGGYDAAPLLSIDTNALDYVHKPQDLQTVLGAVRTMLQQGYLRVSM